MSLNTLNGGMFNSYKSTYSPETYNFLEVLMNEVKMTTAQRLEVKESLKRGKPLPAISKKKFSRSSYVDENLFEMKKNFYFLRRGRDQIIQSGAYNRERFRFIHRNFDLEKEKLQNIMFLGKKLKQSDSFSKNKEKREISKKPKDPITFEDRFNELIKEIEERLEFLQEMEKMGKRKCYEDIIKQEIAGKYREMEKLDKNKSIQFAECLNLFKK